MTQSPARPTLLRSVTWAAALYAHMNRKGDYRAADCQAEFPSLGATVHPPFRNDITSWWLVPAIRSGADGGANAILPWCLRAYSYQRSDGVACICAR